MLGLTSFLPTANRERIGAIVLAVAMIAALSVWAPASAHATGGGGGCTDSWTNTKGGSWFESENWSKKAPPSSEEEACITAAGTYTVEMNQTSTVTVKSLTIGAASGTQTLQVGSTCSLNAVLTTTAGITVGGQGALTLTNGDGCGDSVTLAGPISNAGMIITEPLHGGSRTIQGNITNTGTLVINATTAYNGSKATLTNEGAINLAEGKELAVSNSSSVANATGGKITAASGADVSLSGGTFTEGAGTTSGAKPVIVDDGTLTYTGSGESAIAEHGESSTLSGTSSTGQALSIESTCSEHAKTTTAAAGFTNGGTITLTNGDGCGNNATLVIPSTGTLSNSGTITAEPLHGGSRTIQGNITNTGTLTINATTAYSGASALLKNEGAINVAEGKQLTVSNSGAVVNGAGGQIATVGSARVLMSSGTSFTEGAGTTSGAKPVIVDDGTLNYTGSGESTIAEHGEKSTLSGSLSTGQSLLIESTCGEHALATAGASFTNSGTITLTNSEGCGNNATLVISAGTLTNSGKIASEPDIGGNRTLQGNITNTNTGTLAINANTAYNGSKGVLINEGALNLAEGKQLTVSNLSSAANGTGGSISTSGSGGDVFMDPSTSFTEGAGTTSGTKPVIVDDGTLNYTGEGKSTIALHGSSTLTGNLAASQSLLIESTCGEHALATAGASFTNSGTITLTNGDGCGNNATLALSAGTLTNSGKIITEPANGGNRTLQGNITNTNTGTLAIKATTAYNGVGALLSNAGAINVAEGTQLTVTNGGSVTNSSGGLIFAPGSAALSETGGTFTEGSGKTSGTVPVIVDDATLKYAGTAAEHGAGPIALRGTSTLSGKLVRAGNVLLIQSTCSEHALVTTSGSIENFGTIELTNGDGCGNNATLNLKGGTLTSGGTINVSNPHGGAREIQGSLVSNSLVSVAAGQKLKVSGNYTQTSAARFKTFIASASEFGSLSAAGTATIEGLLAIVPVASFQATAGQTFAILSAVSLSGTFSREIGEPQIKIGLYYKPTYSATGVTLVATQVALSLSATSGLPGSPLTISGSGYPPGDKVVLAFADHKGVKTTLAEATTNSSGEYSAEVTIPAGAVAGAGTVKATSTVSSVHITETFNVT